MLEKYEISRSANTLQRRRRYNTVEKKSTVFSSCNPNALVAVSKSIQAVGF